jgi:HlyD family secretion protein
MKNKQKLLAALAAIIVLVIAVVLITANKTTVEVIEAKRGTISTLIEDTALVQAADNHIVYASQNARIVNIKAEIGQKVEKGQIIMTLESKELDTKLNDTRSLLAQTQSSYNAAQAALRRLELQAQDASTELERIENLYKNNAVSKSEYEKAVLLADSSREAVNEQKANLETLQAQILGLQQNEATLSQLKAELLVLSPIKGVVMELPVKADQTVTTGTALISIADGSKLEVKADILSDDLKDVTTGQKVYISSPLFNNQILEGKVEQIYPQAEERVSALGVVQRRVPVIISLKENANLQPGYEVRVAIETKRLEDIIVVPIESIVENRDGHQHVLLVEDNKIKYVNVVTGISNGNSIEVKSGLEEGDVLVRDGSLGLKEKSRVRPIISD